VKKHHSWRSLGNDIVFELRLCIFSAMHLRKQPSFDYQLFDMVTRLAILIAVLPFEG
jgi:hypothetical protein